MSNYKSVINPYDGKLTIVRAESAFAVKESVATYNDLPISGNNENDLRITKDTDYMYTWSTSSSNGNLSDWQQIGSVSSVDWSAITNKPSSSVGDIDLAVVHKDLINNPHNVTASQIDAMTKSVYDADDDGITDKAEALETQTNQTTDICTGGTADASGYYSGFSPDLAFNDSTLEGWTKTFSSGDWISYTLSSSKIAYRYRFYYTFDSKTPKTWTFEGYNGSTWVELDSRNETQPSGGRWTDWYLFDNTTAYLAYRMVITSIKLGSEIEIREIEINGKNIVQASASDTADAISKKHIRNADTQLDNGGENPVSASEIRTHIDDITSNPHSIDKSDVGLGNVANVNLIYGAINYVIDGGGSAITTGEKDAIRVPFDCTITSVTLLADQSGSIVIDIWKDSYANYAPTVADTITASAKPTLSSAIKSEDTTLTGWTKTISSGDVLKFNVDSCSTITKCTLILGITRT